MTLNYSIEGRYRTQVTTCKYCAATPETWGHAMDVPVAVMIAVSLVNMLLVMSTPGAYRSTHVP